MSKLRNLATASFRWGWFVLLVLLVFGYLVAGLSGEQPLKTDFGLDSQTVAASRIDSSGMPVVNDMGPAILPAVEKINADRNQRLNRLGL